jgi:hypothetical protein
VRSAIWAKGHKKTGAPCYWRGCLAVHDGAEEGWLTALVNQTYIITLCPKHAAELEALVDFYKEDEEFEGGAA